MNKHDWDSLNSLQIGRYAEYFAKMEFTLFGFDVYTSEVDSKGIDFIIRRAKNLYYDVQVKSSRHLNYIFFTKNNFEPRENLLAVVVLFSNGESPSIYLIPSTRWLEQDSLFANRDYEGRKSPPEWGLNLSKRNLHLLSEFDFNQQIVKL